MTVDIERTPDTLVLRMPAPRAVTQVFIALSWLPFLAIALAVVWEAILSTPVLGRQHGASGFAIGAFFIVFSLGILGACVFGLAGAVFGLVGREVVTLTGHRLTLEYVAFGVRVRERAEAEGVGNVRLAPPEKVAFKRWRAPVAKLLFDADGRTLGFGAGLTDAEAADVLAVLEERLGRG